MLRLDPEIAVVTNVELDHHATYGSLRELDDAFRAFLAGAPRRSSGTAPSCARWRGTGAGRRLRRRSTPTLDARRLALRAGAGTEVRCAVPGAHNARNAAAALEAARAGGRRRRRGGRGAGATSAAPGGASSCSGAARAGARVVDDYAHHPTEVAATIAAARTLRAAPAASRSSSRTSSRARARSPASSAPRWRGADAAVVLDVYPARERAEDFPGVERPAVAEAAADAAGGRPVLWLPDFDAAERGPARPARATATSCSYGRGRRRRARPPAASA